MDYFRPESFSLKFCFTLWESQEQRESQPRSSSVSLCRNHKNKMESQPQKPKESMPSQVITEQVEDIANTEEELDPKGEVESPLKIPTTDTTCLQVSSIGF